MDDSSIFDIAIEDAALSEKPHHASSPYVELPDGHIRLLEILPGPAGSIISCQIVQVPLQSNPKYTALSYVWGSGSAQCSIELNGHCVFIRKNLWRFLHQVRMLDCEMFGRLWIDALCINQAKTEERSRQVSIMPRIYTAAKHVLVWLGPAYGNSDIAMQALSEATRCRKKEGLIKPSHEVAITIRKLCTRAYWTRLWVYQELMLARTKLIMCGAKVNHERMFTILLLGIDDRKLRPNEDVGKRFEYNKIRTSPAVAMIEQSTRSLVHTTLWDWMLITKDLGCSEERDKVYALLGIAEFGHANLTADYSVPIPTLLNEVLKLHYEREPPESLNQVVDDCETLQKLFSADSGSIFSLPDEREQFPHHIDADMEALPLSPPRCYPVNLWWASFYGHSAVERLFISEKALDASSLLIPAVEMCNPAAVQLLIGMPEIELKSKDAGGQTVLHIAAEGHGECWTEIVKLLLESGAAELNSKDVLGRTALHIAIRHKRTAIAKLLIGAQGVDVHSRDYQGDTPLHEAARWGYQRITRRLLDSDEIEINSTNETGRTPLHEAITSGEPDVAAMILDTGKANITIRDIYGLSPLRLAVRSEIESNVKHLLDLCQNNLDRIEVEERRYDGNLLHSAAHVGSDGIAKLLLDTGQFDIREKDVDGQTALDIAIKHGRTKALIRLLSNAMEVEREEIDGAA